MTKASNIKVQNNNWVKEEAEIVFAPFSSESNNCQKKKMVIIQHGSQEISFSFFLYPLFQLGLGMIDTFKRIRI